MCMKKSLLISLLLVALNNNALASTKLVDEKPTPVTVATLDELAIFPINNVPASAISENSSTLSSEIHGLVASLPVKVGEKVTKGQVIATLECEDYNLILQQAEAEKKALEAKAQFSEWQLARTKKLATQNNASQESLHQYEAELKELASRLISQEAKISNAQNNIGRCKIVAPYDSIVVARHANIGEYVTPGTKLVHVVDTINLEVESLLHVTEIELITEADAIKFTTTEGDYPVVIRSIVQSQDPTSRTQLIRLRFKDSQPLPGTPGRLVWSSNQPALPAEYLRQLGYKLGIYVANGNHAKFIHLTNAVEGQPVVIQDALPYKIIVDGRYAITDGSLIDIQNLKK